MNKTKLRREAAPKRQAPRSNKSKTRSRSASERPGGRPGKTELRPATASERQRATDYLSRHERRDYRTKEEQAADFLREAIIAGVFPRGSRLKQAEIAERLQLSITPVREALKLLEAEGYLTWDSYRGACVAPFDAGASAEVLELRLLLECRLIRGTAEKATARDITDLKDLAKDFEQALKARDLIAARGINYRFHQRLYGIAEMPQTLQFVQILWARYAFDLLNAAEGRGPDAVSEHDEILQALVDGDASAAMLALRQHIESGWSFLKST